MYLKNKNIIMLFCLMLFFASAWTQTKFDSLVLELDKYTTINGNDSKSLSLVEEIFLESYNLDPFLASEYAAMGKQMAEEIKDSLAIAKFEIYIGDTYFKQKVYYRAMEEYFIAYEIYSDANDKPNLAKCFIKVGKTYNAQAVYDVAEEYFIKAKKIYEELENQTGVSDALFHLGMSNISLDENQALEYFYEAAEIQEKEDEQAMLAHTRRYIALAHNELYEKETALKMMHLSLGYYIKQSDKFELAETYFTFGQIYLLNEDLKPSLEYFKKALKIYDAISSHEKIAETYYKIGEIYLNQDNTIEAINHANLCNEIAEVYNFPELTKNAYKILAFAYEKNGDFETALAAHKEYLRMINEISEQKKREQFSEFQMNLETQKQQKEIELLEISAEKQKLEDAQKEYKRNIIFAITITLLVLGFIIGLYFRYREKLKANELLENSNKLLTKEIEVRRLAEAELKNSEEKYRLLFRKTPIGIMQFNENFYITNVNDRFAQILKLNRRQLIDVDLATVFDRTVLYLFNNALDTNNEIVSEEREIFSNNEVVYVSMTIKPYFYTIDNEVVKGGIVIVEDLTEKKKTEQMFDHKAVKKQVLLNAFPDNLILTSRKGEIIESHLPDFPEAKAEVKSLKNLFDGDILIEIFVKMKYVIENSISVSFKYFDAELQNNLFIRILPESKQNAIIIVQLENNEHINGNDSKIGTNNVTKKTPRKNVEDIEIAFEKSILPIYKNIQKNLSFILIKGLAEQLKNIGEKFDDEEINSFGTELLEYITTFNVIKVNEMISKFPNFAAKYLNNYILDF